MAARWHLNKNTGQPAKCVAQPGKCPLGGDSPHFSSQKQAKAFVEELNSMPTGNEHDPISISEFQKRFKPISTQDADKVLNKVFSKFAADATNISNTYLETSSSLKEARERHFDIRDNLLARGKTDQMISDFAESRHCFDLAEFCRNSGEEPLVSAYFRVRGDNLERRILGRPEDKNLESRIRVSLPPGCFDKFA